VRPGKEHGARSREQGTDKRLLSNPLPEGEGRVRAAVSPLRVLIAKVGLDGHDRGVKIVARALRDAGLEVIYLGIHNTPEEIASAALQEDVDAIGLSIHSAAHLTLFGELMKLLKKTSADNKVVFGGGIVPEEDVAKLKKMGVKEIFTPGATLEEIVAFVQSIGRQRDRIQKTGATGQKRERSQKSGVRSQKKRR
jgi:methylmalonyl-CoA mutase C-terminal domain/subunit